MSALEGGGGVKSAGIRPFFFSFLELPGRGKRCAATTLPATSILEPAKYYRERNVAFLSRGGLGRSSTRARRAKRDVEEVLSNCRLRAKGERTTRGK